MKYVNSEKKLHRGTKIILFVCSILFIAIDNVHATEKIDFEWGNYIRQEYYAKEVAELDDGYVVYGANYAVFYDNDGKLIKKASNENLYCDFITYDQENDNFLCSINRYDYKDNERINTNYFYILDSDLTVQKEYNKQNLIFRTNCINITENEYILIDSSSGETLIINKNTSNMDYYAWEELSPSEHKKYWGKYYLFNIAYDNSTTDREYIEYKNNDSYQLLTYYDNDDERFGIEVYDKQNKLLFDQRFKTKNPLIAELAADGYYVLSEEDIDSREDEQCENEEYCTSQLVISKYNFSKELIYKENLQKMNSGYYDYIYSEGRKATSLKKVKSGLIIISNYIVERKTLEEELSGRDPAIIKYSISYDIETKTDGNGDVKVISSEKVGNEVEFEVIPKDGFELELVTVTDANGNKLTFTTNTFTMPSSDVTIEATFKKSIINPNTRDIALICMITVSIICGIIVVYTKHKIKI